MRLLWSSDGVLSIDFSFSPSSTFSGGTRSCLGWRFACVDSPFCYSRNANGSSLNSVIEIQTFLVTLIRKFDISQADHQPQIRRAKSGVMVPLVLGEEYKGVQLPLRITTIRNG